jgi:hypothetical protein
MRTDYYRLIDRLAVPCSTREWALWFGHASLKERQVGFDTVGPAEVSTVFVGINYNFFGKGPPLLFETMVFGIDPEDCGNMIRRYHTWDEAQKGHAVILAVVRELVAKADSNIYADEANE